ncbi:tRNA adenosine(34) deaminase TadA [Neisseria wadsworthii]|uniref:tRNA adenosine(34) deaminase TadA n=1 Tax=Neisseria wadsworthii TaxID=607711 RepID=UPI000D31BAAD|nr:tRNA adenosine(34) deaminase TadA [Neisseria wadsworthii]
MQLTTPPLAPKTLYTLNSLGIHTLEDLRQTGAPTAFLLLKAAGLTATRSTLWQLAALLQNTTPQTLCLSEKNSLLESIRNHPPVDVFPPQTEMEAFMRLALQQAEQSAALGEIPVGAVIIHNGTLITAAHNTCINSCNISQHAEIRALAAAGAALQNYRLDGCDVYVTIEPCSMCASALIQARVRRVIYGAAEPKTGAAGSIMNLFTNTLLNKHTAIKGGILSAECSSILQRFFQNKRS